MKFKIIILMLVLSIGIVGAIEEGQIITQGQLDNIDVSTINAQFLECQEEGRVFEIPQLRYRYSCLNVREHGEDYEIYRDEYVSQAHIVDVGVCILQHGLSYCQDQYQSHFQNQWNDRLDKIKRWVLAHQTSPYVTQILGWFEQWTPW